MVPIPADYVAAPTGTINVVGSDAEGRAIRFAFNTGSLKWTSEDLTVVAVPM
ncbi:MAG: hypothetical protein JNM07_03830 [Phycisphaerae bacterium]|nr:hypothetical protein [Phycisphaerae bacterium]